MSNATWASRTDPLQAKAESISNSSTSGTIYLRSGLEGSIAGGTTATEKGGRIFKSKVKKEGEEVLVQPMVRQAVPTAAHGSAQGSRDPLAAHRIPQARADKCLKEAVTLWE